MTVMSNKRKLILQKVIVTKHMVIEVGSVNVSLHYMLKIRCISHLLWLIWHGMPKRAV